MEILNFLGGFFRGATPGSLPLATVSYDNICKRFTPFLRPWGWYIIIAQKRVSTNTVIKGT